MSSFLNRRRRHRQTAHEHGEPPSHRCAGQLIGSYGLVPSVQARERAQNVLFSTSMRVPCVDTDRTRSFPVSYHGRDRRDRRNRGSGGGPPSEPVHMQPSTESERFLDGTLAAVRTL
uniref:(northern house mosquito) hypothetical protein n=1 Tax=Culex pipiens TaxID=7175 RepID=A0A8D8AH10_CULPI